MSTLGIGIIGCGGITLQNHLPGLALCPDVRVAALCDSDPGTLQRASTATGCTVTTSDYHQLLARDDVHAIIIATPNLLHFPIAMSAIAAYDALARAQDKPPLTARRAWYWWGYLNRADRDRLSDGLILAGVPDVMPASP